MDHQDMRRNAQTERTVRKPKKQNKFQTFFTKEFWKDKFHRESNRTAEKQNVSEKTVQPKAPKPQKLQVQEGAGFWQNTAHVAKWVCLWGYRLRGVLLAIPVVVVAISMAIRNMAQLSDSVGINLLASGEYQFMVNKGVAVLGPLALTAVCLLFMFLSRRVLYPWLISVFTLVVPWLIWITNVFPS